MGWFTKFFKSREEKKYWRDRRAGYKSYLLTGHWNSVRLAKLKAVGYRCENCGRRAKLHVHHLHYKSLGEEKLSDLRALCKSCHYSRDNHPWK